MAKEFSLTHSDLQNLDDAALESKATRHLSTLLKDIPYDKNVAFTHSLPKGWNVVYSTINLEAEVNNGGFEQYFGNTLRHLNSDDIEALETIGAKKRADLARKALKHFLEIMAAKWKESGGTKDLTSHDLQDVFKNCKFDDLDRQFFSSEENLTFLRAAYIRKNTELFIGRPALP